MAGRQVHLDLPGPDPRMIDETDWPWMLRSDLQSICGQAGDVARVAFSAVHEVPVAVRHRLQQHARDTHSVDLAIVDGQAISHMLAQADLVWIAERWLDLPSVLVPDDPGNPQPDW